MKKIMRILVKLEAIDVSLALSLMCLFFVFVVHQQAVHAGFLLLAFFATFYWLKYGYQKISQWLDKE